MDTLLAKYTHLQLPPNAIALYAPDGTISFSDLNNWANHIASQLGSSVKGQRVGLLFQPSLAYVASLLACLKAGAISQLLEPTTPTALFPQLNLCLCGENFLPETKTFAKQAIPIVQMPSKHSSDYVYSGHVAGLHCLETSGSSGKPTVVTMGRDAMLQHIEEMGAAYAYRPGANHANLARHTRAAWVDGFWRVLFSGSGFVFFDLYQETFDQIYQRLKQTSVASIQALPSLCDALAGQNPGAESLSSVEHLILSGEPVSPKLLKRIAPLFSANCPLTINYSSSETQHIANFKTNLAEAKSLPQLLAGTPLPSRTVELRNDQDQIVSPGESGEITVTSAYLALAIEGNQADKRLITHPEQPALKTFYTRDLGRWNNEGELEYLGRLDRQLKIRGVRIDPLIIEQELLKIPGIEQASVLGLETYPEQFELVAVLICNEHSISHDELYQRLRQTLPLASVPTRYLNVETFPRLKSGKVDLTTLKQRCLSLLNISHSSDSDKKEPELLVFLRKLWSEILGKPIPIKVQAFPLEGGDSLKIMALVTRLSQLGAGGIDFNWVITHSTLESQFQALADQSETLLKTPLILPPLFEQSPVAIAQTQILLRSEDDSQLKSKPLIIFGIGSTAQVMHYYLKKMGHTIVAFTVDRPYLRQTVFEACPVIAFDEIEVYYPPEKYDILIAIGYPQMNQLRAQKCQQAEARGYRLSNFIHPSATVWESLVLTPNSSIGENCLIQPFVQLGINVYIGGDSNIGHHSVLGDHCFIASGVTLGGGVIVEPFAFLGTGAIVRNKVRIAARSVIGAGAVILHDTRKGGVYTAPEALESNFSSDVLYPG